MTMSQITFKQIDEARKILGLDEEVNLDEIKEAYKKLAIQYHPDKCKDPDKRKCEEVFKKIAHARDIVVSYCANYRYSFKEDIVKKNLIDKDTYNHMKQFYEGLFGKLDL